MSPNLDEFGFVPAAVVVDFEDALEDFGNVSQVIDIVRLGRGGQQFLGRLDSVVDFNCRFYQFLFHNLLGTGQVFAVVEEEPLHHVLEYHFEGVGQERFHVEQVVMAAVTEGNGVAALGRRTHGGQEGDVFKVFEFEGFQVVPSAFVHPLAQDFDGRLGHVGFFERHVEVVDEDDDAGFAILERLVVYFINFINFIILLI